VAPENAECEVAAGVDLQGTVWSGAAAVSSLQFVWSRSNLPVSLPYHITGVLQHSIRYNVTTATSRCHVTLT
jgi:hypothetical protein